MLDPVFQFIEKFITDFTWRRLTLFFSFLSLVVLIVVIYEWYTGSYELTKYKSAVEILKELEPLINSEHTEISEPAKSISSNILAVVQNRSITNTVEINFSPRISQAIFAGLPWLIFLLLYLPIAAKEGKEEVYNAILGFIVICTIATFIGAAIPPSWNDWLRYGLPLFVSIIVIAVAAYFNNDD